MIKRFSLMSFVAGFMVGALFAAAWFFDKNPSLLPPVFTSQSLPSSSTRESLPESGAISVANQSAGTEVTIESITVSPPGVWVAVREVNDNDLGNVLGAVRVDGPRSAISVPLLRATTPGLPYAVELYRDDGGAIFDLATDSVYIDFATGLPVIARFTTKQ